MQDFKVDNRLWLVKHEMSLGPAAGPPPAPPDVNHIIVIDCSGSMERELPLIREQLKLKLPKLVGEDDTVSIIWFSGRGEYGVLAEAEPVATLKELADLNRAIDRWLRPVGLTGFKEPLLAVSGLVERLIKKHPRNVNSMFFMSDGCDNQWPRAEVLSAVDQAARRLSAATVVEYGFYADRALLAKMAERCGGNLIFAEGFHKYQPAFEHAMARRPAPSRVAVDLGGDVIGGFAFALHDGEVLTFGVSGTTVSVPADVERIWFLSPKKQGAAKKTTLAEVNPEALAALYAAASLFAVRMQPKVVLPLLARTGDVNLIDLFGSCFGKQRYSEFADATQLAAFKPAARLTKGFDQDRVPKADAFCVLDFLRLLAADEGNRVLLDHEAFSYNRIGRARLDASENLTADEQAEMEALAAELGKTKAAKRVAEINARVAEITAKKRPGLKFSPTSVGGYPAEDLVFASTRANVSVLVRKEGMVDLSGVAPPPGVPEQFPTNIWRNYTIVKDGLINVGKLPVLLTAESLKTLAEANVPLGFSSNNAARLDRPVEAILDLAALPIINRKMVKEVSAARLFKLEYEAFKCAAEQKVLNDAIKERVPPGRSEGLAEKYGKEAADWLKDHGITDRGFSPKSVSAEATDVYMAKEIEVKAKGLGTLRSVAAVRDAAANGKKLSLGDSLMLAALNALDAAAGAHTEDGFIEYLKTMAELAKRRRRNLLHKLAEIKFAVIVGQTWFKEFASLDEHTLTIDVDGQPLEFSVEMKEVEEKI